MSREYGLGRIPAPDARDKKHPLRMVTPKRATVATRYWRTGPVLDQGAAPACVGYSWAQFIASAPIMSRLALNYPFALYKAAQGLDEWEGSNYAGSSVRGGVKALEAEGRVSEYLWSTDADEVRRYVLSRGTLVIGIDWPESFFSPVKKPSGQYLEPDRTDAGGHAILVCGFSEKRRAFRLINSWGEDWGTEGRAWMHLDVMADRLSQPFAEACSALEQRSA